MFRLEMFYKSYIEHSLYNLMVQIFYKIGIGIINSRKVLG